MASGGLSSPACSPCSLRCARTWPLKPRTPAPAPRRAARAPLAWLVSRLRCLPGGVRGRGRTSSRHILPHLSGNFLWGFHSSAALGNSWRRAFREEMLPWTSRRVLKTENFLFCLMRTSESGGLINQGPSPGSVLWEGLSGASFSVFCFFSSGEKRRRRWWKRRF